MPLYNHGDRVAGVQAVRRDVGGDRRARHCLLAIDLDLDGRRQCGRFIRPRGFIGLIGGVFTILRICGQWQVGDDVPQDALSQLQACNELTLRLNVVKAGIANGTLVVTGEHVVAPETDVKGLLVVTTQLVLSAVHLWHETIMGRTIDEDAGTEQS